MMGNKKGLQVVFKLITIIILTSCQGCCSDDNDTENTPSEYDYDPNTTTDYGSYITMCEKSNVRTFRSIFLPIVYSIICFLGLLGNMLVMITFLYFKRLKTMTDVYLLNLAAADILFVLTLPFLATSVAKEWIFGNVFCKVVQCIYKLSFFNGMILLMLISIDRYFAIVQAATAHRHRARTNFLGKISCILGWVISFVLSTPELARSGEKLIDGKNRCTYITENFLEFTGRVQIPQMIVGFVVPLFVMLYCYTVIIKTLLQSRNFERNKAIKVIIAVVLVFICFQVPYNSIVLLKTIESFNATNTNCKFSREVDIAEDVTYSLACVRCCLNPFLYAFIGVKFRNDLLKLLKELGCMTQEQMFRLSTLRKKQRSSFATETDTTTTFSP
ncbi:C-C chemokine receptor type 7 isoform X2 [Protopterus annectens]|uniref:C-C chemokine receptor type 7 isoform X2 n=1 Tax=Protopterus annectens TaxID=7888 RepID=UPI001CF95E36|nr:C-C chemokine receptor type 7 isoform X2 [Protopterus annectens]